MSDLPQASGSRRIVGVAVSAATAAIALALIFSVLRVDRTHELPIVVRLCIAFFTLEAARMFVQLVLGATFYRSAPEPTDGQQWPTVSVVIPAWNEEVGLARTIRSVLASDYPHLEVVIVNDGSTDATVAIAEFFSRNRSHQVVVIDRPNGGKGTALNSGICAALGDIIVNVDADSVLEPDAIRNMAKWFMIDTVDAVVGRVALGNTAGMLGRVQAFEYQLGFHLKRTQSLLNSIFILSGAFCGYRKSSYLATKGFRDFSKTEDMDFSLQLRQRGRRLVYAADAVCHTEGPEDLRGLVNQRTRWKFGGLSCFAHHRRLMFSLRRPNRLLGWYELPNAMLGYLQLLLYPLILTLAIGLPLVTGDVIYLAMIVAAVPVNFVVVFLTAGSSLRSWVQLPLLTFYMSVAMLVEHVTMVRALHLQLTGRDVGWTNWTRVGLDPELATPIPLPPVRRHSHADAA